VARGGSVIDPKVVEALVAALGELVPDSEAAQLSFAQSYPAGAALAEPLTEREFEVLRLVADGASNQEIARKLVVTLAAAKTDVTHIFGKPDAESRVQVVARARTLGLLPPQMEGRVGRRAERSRRSRRVLLAHRRREEPPPQTRSGHWRSQAGREGWRR
jgi:DNA-binding CsgD family transcriptional regulator